MIRFLSSVFAALGFGAHAQVPVNAQAPGRRAPVKSLTAALVLASAAAAWAGTPEDLRALEQTRRDAIARKDFATLERIYAPNFVAVVGNGQVFDRARLFAAFRATDPALTFAGDEIDVLDFGDTAIVLGRLSARDASGAVVAMSRFSHTFRRAEGQWRCVFGQSTPIPMR